MPNRRDPGSLSRNRPRIVRQQLISFEKKTLLHMVRRALSSCAPNSIDTSGGRGRGEALLLDQCRAFDLFASVDAHLCRGGPRRLFKLRQMGTFGVHMKGILPWLGSSCRYNSLNSFCPALAALVSPEQNIIFLSAHFFFTSLIPFARQPGQSVVLGRLSLCLRRRLHTELDLQSLFGLLRTAVLIG